MTKAALGISAVIFPPFFCGTFASYSRYGGLRTYLYQMHDLVPSSSINLNKYHNGSTMLRRKNAPF
jgi:hypothetical protein